MKKRNMKTIKEYMRAPYRMEIDADPEEGGFVASYPDLPGCISCGETIEESIKNVQEAKRCWIETAMEDGVAIPDPETVKEYSGQFKLRIPKELHQSLALHSKQEGISMNQYCLYLLTKRDALESR